MKKALIIMTVALFLAGCASGELQGEVLNDELVTEFNANFETDVIQYNGELLKPTPCHEVEEEIIIEDNTAVLEIDLVEEDDGEMCAQVVEEEAIMGSEMIDEAPTEFLVRINGEDAFRMDV